MLLLQLRLILDLNLLDVLLREQHGLGFQGLHLFGFALLGIEG